MGRATKENDNPYILKGGEYDRELVMQYICEHIASSEHGLGTILKNSPHQLPARATVNLWLTEDDALSDKYARAKALQAEFMEESILDIVDNQAAEPIIIEGTVLRDQNGNVLTAVTSASVQHAKLRAESRKWLMAKLQPKKYGDRIQQDVEITDASSLAERLASRRRVRRGADQDS